MKYKKRQNISTIVVDAVKYMGDDVDEIIAWSQDKIYWNNSLHKLMIKDVPETHTLVPGDMVIEPGYIIVKYIDNKYYAYDNKTFNDMYTKIDSNATFSEAIDAVKSGYNVKRDNWGDGRYVTLMVIHDTPCIILRYSNGTFSAWSPKDEDMFADDWIIIV